LATVSHFSFSSMSIDRTVVRSCPDPWVPGCKILDVLANHPLAPNPAFTAGLSLNQIPRGKNDGQRTGRQVLIKRMAIKYWMTALDTQLASVYCRLVIFLDRQFTGVGAVPLVVLSQQTLDSFQSPYTRDRFVILYDETHCMDLVNHNGGATGQHLQTPLTNVVLDVDTTLTYKGSAAIDMRGNNLSYFVITEAAGYTNAYLHMTTRLFYVDF